MSKIPERPNIEALEITLESYQRNWQVRGIDAHQHVAVAQQEVMLKLPDLLAYVKALEAAPIVQMHGRRTVMSDKYDLNARDWALLALAAERAKLPEYKRTAIHIHDIDQAERLEIAALIEMPDGEWYVPTAAGLQALADHAATPASILREQRVRAALEQAVYMLDDYSSPTITVGHETTQKFVKETRAMLDGTSEDGDHEYDT